MRWIGVFLGILGILASLTAIFAIQFGIDNDPGWGKGRYILFGLGIVLIGSGIVVSKWQAVQQWVDRVDRKITHAIGHWRSQFLKNRIARGGISFVRGIRRFPPLAWIPASEVARTRIVFVFIILFTFLTILFYATAGTFTQFFSYFHSYYDRLANAFLQGEVALLEQPDASLIALVDPYQFENRTNVDYIWDVSYYQGKFYLYWGPVPALLMAAIKLINQSRIEDQAIVVVGLIGVAAWITFMGYQFTRKFYPSSNKLICFVFGCACALNIYLLGYLGRPGIYEAAIIAGQFFFLCGIAALLWTESGKHGVGYLIAGLCFGLAVGSRATIIIGVAWIILMVLIRSFQKVGKSLRQKIIHAGLFLLPMLILGSGLLWYNAARFGNIFENGFRYQLSSSRKSTDTSSTFSTTYIIPNLYGYLVRAPERTGAFPYIRIPPVTESNWPWYIRLPENYTYHEAQAGLLAVFPLVFLVPLEVMRCASLFGSMLRGKSARGRPFLRESLLHLMTNDANWWFVLLSGFVLGQMSAIFTYYFSSLRFHVDYLPALALLCWLCYGRIDQSLMVHPRWRFVFTLTVLVLALYSLYVGFMGTFTVGDGLFMKHNPMLFEQIKNVFQ